ncbi:hypothetical protein AHF37_09989 [Paragonimus kellicotti]|nr:hypothetical protein AHF37_09989 [Paragonimus kellicotti]
MSGPSVTFVDGRPPRTRRASRLRKFPHTFLHELISRSFRSEYKFLLHGICLPENTPIQWLSEHMAYADNFVHIVAWSSSRFNQALEL